MAFGEQGKNGMRRRGVFRRVLRWLLVLIALPFVLTPVAVVIDPPITTLMLLRLLEGNGIRQSWVSLDEIAPVLPNTVLMSEDGQFCAHSGVDWGAVQDVVEDVIDGEDGPRGASTITMQTAKNLYLWPYRSYVRKAFEVPLAYWIDLILPKRRIMEIYLNIVEWGPGIYGAEAAARAHFGKSAKDLTQQEAGLLAAVLPNPLARNAGRPGPQTGRLAARAAQRGAQAGGYNDCLK